MGEMQDCSQSTVSIYSGDNAAFLMRQVKDLGKNFMKEAANGMIRRNLMKNVSTFNKFTFVQCMFSIFENRAYFIISMINTVQHFGDKQSYEGIKGAKRSEEAKEQVRGEKLGGLQGCSQLMMPIQMLDDLTLLKSQVRHLSRNLMKSVRKYLEQEEMTDQMAEALKRVEGERDILQLKNTKLRQQLDRIMKIEHTINQEVNFREQLIEESREEEKSIIIADKQKIIKELEKMNCRLTEKGEEQQKRIETLEEFSRTMKVESEKSMQRSKEVLSRCQKTQSQRNFLKEVNSNLNFQLEELLGSIGVLKLENKQLQRQLAQKNTSFNGISQMQLVNLNQSQSLPQVLSKLQMLTEENSELKKDKANLLAECNDIKDRMNKLTGSEKDIEHIVIDRFMAVIGCYRQRLLEGGSGIGIRTNLDLKKEAFMKRMAREYQKYTEKMQ